MNQHNKTPITHHELRQFTGDTLRYRSNNRSVLYTPGLKHLAVRADAYWLIEAIALYLTDRPREFPDPRLKTLQFWRLEVHDDRSATLTSRADSGVEPYVTQQIGYTDFPLESIDIWAGFDGQHWSLYLPSEH